MIAELPSIAQARTGGELRVGDDSMPAMALEKSPLHIAALADQCVQCGLCLPVCPTYALDRSESESPRGRIAIAAALARGEAEPTAALRSHLDHCLGCLGCERVCPAQVRYGELLVETRALIGPSPQRPRLLLEAIRRPALLQAIRRAAKLLGWPRWKPTLLRALSPGSAWRAGLALLPADRTEHADAASLALASPDGEGELLALFPGCVASVEDAEAQAAAQRLLQAAGYRVIQLPAFCCGALDLHAGAAEAAASAAQRVRDAWQRSGATQLLSVTPGCLGSLRQALPEAKVADPYALLAARVDRLHFRALPERVALQVPCTQANVARSEHALLELLRRIPGLELQRLGTPPYCCGAAGSHLLEFPERAAALRAPMLARLDALAPQRWLSSNIGCRLHLAAGLEAEGKHWPHAHPLSLLAQQLESPASSPEPP